MYCNVIVLVFLLVIKYVCQPVDYSKARLCLCIAVFREGEGDVCVQNLITT